jgi:hypothetical protein
VNSLAISPAKIRQPLHVLLHMYSNLHFSIHIGPIIVGLRYANPTYHTATETFHAALYRTVARNWPIGVEDCKTAMNIKESTMQSEHFDLNDIQHEPTDQQLEALMMSVSVEARRRAEAARKELMARLRAEIAAANRSRESAG